MTTGTRFIPFNAPFLQFVKPNFRKLWNIIISPKMDEDKQIKIVFMIFEAIHDKLTYLRGTLVLAGKLEQVVQVHECISGIVMGASTIT